MSDVIKLLPEKIANQIAAGEVVQRPASVVKELLENSVDAGASLIQLYVKEAGKASIQVIDDGKGMSVTDARMSFERHATSKITNSEDLFGLRTMGFRGEALASIAAVAQVDLKTMQNEVELGTEIIIHGSEIKSQEPVQTKKGTSIAVKNLFYNVPARRNFLKSNPVELRHVTDEFHRVALANPQVSFSFCQNDLEVYKLDQGKLSKRIVQIFGKNYQNQLIPCQEDTPEIQIRGYIGKPEHAKKTRGEQFFFVNNRFIKSPYLYHAVSTAYEGLLKEDYFPFFVLFFEMDPALVDVNVHPTKTEVKFQDDRLLYGIIHSAVRQALSTYNVAPSLDFSADINFEFATKKNEGFQSQQERNYSQFKTLETEKRSVENWSDLYEIAKKEDQYILENIEAERPERTVILRSGIGFIDEKSTQKKHSLQIHGEYLIRQVKSGMVVIDQQAAHERILFEKYLKVLSESRATSQSCMFPQQISLNASDFALVNELSDEIQKLGFEFETAGTSNIVITGVPSDLLNCDEKEVFEGLIEQFKQNHQRLKLSFKENLARSLAKRTALRKGKVLEMEEIDELIDQLFACEQPNYTPSGNATFIILSLDRLASFFK